MCQPGRGLACSAMVDRYQSRHGQGALESYMVDQPTIPQVTEQQLPGWLLQQVPALIAAYTSEMDQRIQGDIPNDEWSPRPNAYFVLSFVLEPHLIELLDTGDEHEVQRIFTLLEYLAEHGDAAVQNEL